MESTLILVYFIVVPRAPEPLRFSPYPDQMVDQAPRDDLYSPERQRRPGQLDEPQRLIPSEDHVT